jgi:anti-anti-sigma factor
MEMTHIIKDATLHLTLRGRFTFLENSRFREIVRSLPKGEVRHVQIHIKDLTFVDSAALGMLLLIREEAHKHSIDIALVSPQGQPEKMFAMARFDQLFSMVL